MPGDLPMVAAAGGAWVRGLRAAGQGFTVTIGKHVKARIRARMAKTGERYTAARRHVLGTGGVGTGVGTDQHPDGSAAEPARSDRSRLATVVDHGHPLTGGMHPESAAVAALLAKHGRPASEAMALGVGGGLGAGYILWEFATHDSPILTIGFHHRWNYLDWSERALSSLGATTEVHTTSGAAGAAATLTRALAAGRPAICWPDRFHVGYWQLPPHLDGHGGHAVLAYAEDGGRVHVDDRNVEPLTVERATFDRARARVPSYRNRLVTVTGLAELDLPAAIRAGIAVTVGHLGGTSASFALPAWRKWARLVTDGRNAKGWPRVFADGKGLAGALLSAWEGIEPAGMTGGHLRGLYADFLDEAAGIVDEPALTSCADAFREAGERWHDAADVMLPADVPAYARLRELTTELAMGVVAGDAGADDRAEVATELWAVRAEYDRTPPVAPDFAAIGAALTAVYEAEHAAVEQLRDTIAR